ncbi:MAG: cysteine desulfurase [Lachnospiraceae bacterium]|nr:cysteine desulfurase [Lachnospiraceae bacterium]
MKEIYLDNSATTRVFPEAAQLMSEIYLNDYGNPSSMHHMGVMAERRIMEAGNILADILKVNRKNLIYTSCGSESDNLAIIGGAHANARNGKHVITSSIEHPGVSEAFAHLKEEGYEVTVLPVDRYGRVPVSALEEALRDDTVLVSVMHVNNELGSVQPVEEMAEVIKKRNPKTLFHVDAVQSFGKFRIYPKRAGIDLLSASGHKIHGPKGVGLLYIADKVRVENLIYGGGQQQGLRSGTENVAGIAGMALAAKMLYDDLDRETQRLYAMKEEFIRGILQIPGVSVNGIEFDENGAPVMDPAKTAPHIISLSAKDVRAEVLLHALEEKGIYVSAGSACASNRPHISETLTAIGLKKDLLDSTVRVSMSVMTTEEEMKAAEDALKELIPFLSRFRRH